MGFEQGAERGVEEADHTARSARPDIPVTKKPGTMRETSIKAMRKAASE